MKEVGIKFLDGGYCTHLERMVITDGRFKTVKFPSIFNLIQHPERGNILFDTGYSTHFFEACEKYPQKLYAKITPVHLTESDLAISKLKTYGVKSEEVNYIILSHFHADHIAAIKDFPKARFIYLASAYDYVSKRKGFNAVRKGILHDLLPRDFVARSEVIDERKEVVTNEIPLNDCFSKVFDIFGDKSIYAVDLPGHMRGQMGLFLRDHKEEHFLIADACWLSRSYRDMTFPSKLTMSIMDNPKQYKDTLYKIHQVYNSYPEINIAPSHCGETYCNHVECKSEWGKTAMNALEGKMQKGISTESTDPQFKV